MKSTIMYCSKVENGYYNFYPSPELVQSCGHRIVYKVRVTEIEAATPGCYWGWWGNEDANFIFVYIKRFLLEMCFPYGFQPEIDKGVGVDLPVKIDIMYEED
jgi:hypothetical protein